MKIWFHCLYFIYPKKLPTAFKNPPPSSVLYLFISSVMSGIDMFAILDPAVSKKMGLHSIKTGFGGKEIIFKSSSMPLSKSCKRDINGRLVFVTTPTLLCLALSNAYLADSTVNLFLD